MTTISASEFFGGKPPEQPAQPTSPSKKRSVAKDIALGIAKGAATVIKDTGDLAAAAAPNLIGGPVLSAVPGVRRAITDVVGSAKDRVQRAVGLTDERLKAENQTQRIAKGATVIASAALPGGGAKVAAKAASVVPKVAAVPVKAAGRGIEATGEKIQQSVIRPSINDIKDGFKIENVAKYDVGGSLPETITKTHAKLNELGQQLKTTLKDTDAKINLPAVLRRTAERLGADKAGTFGDNAALDRVLDQIADEVKRVGDDIDLVAATNVKRGAGNKGAWAYNRPEADASAIERAYTEFYSVLKEEIEKAAPEGVRAINKQLSELIPIQNAALRRLPVEQRNNVFSLTDSIGFFSALYDPKALLLVGASRAARSGKVGEALVKGGQKIQGKR